MKIITKASLITSLVVQNLEFEIEYDFLTYVMWKEFLTKNKQKTMKNDNFSFRVENGNHSTLKFRDNDKCLLYYVESYN